MLPLQGANGLIVLFTQGVAIGLGYKGPSARRIIWNLELETLNFNLC